MTNQVEQKESSKVSEAKFSGKKSKITEHHDLGPRFQKCLFCFQATCHILEQQGVLNILDNLWLLTEKVGMLMSLHPIHQDT